MLLIKAITSENLIKAAVATAALSLCALHFSPAMSSIAMMLFFGLVLILARKDGLLKNKILILLTLSWCLWQLLNQFYFGYDSEAIRKTILRLPLLLLSLVWLLRYDLSIRMAIPGILMLGLVHTWIGGASVLNYLGHYRFLNQMILESKPLPLFSSVYHIEFSLMLAVVSLLQISCLRFTDTGWQRNLMLFTVLINVISLHALSARTGLLGFWMAIPFLIGHIDLPIWLRGGRKWFLLTIPILLMLSIPSLRNRIINTIDDLTAVTQNQDLSDKSFGRRWESWKITYNLIKRHPLCGVGMSGAENSLIKEFKNKRSYLHVTDQIQPHNQFLELALQSGVIPVLLLLVWFFWILLYYYNRGNFAGIAILVALGVSMLFESYLERQSGVAIFVIAVFFVLFTEKRNNIINN